MVTLTADQERALEILVEDDDGPGTVFTQKVSMLAGPAGSGKTTLMQVLDTIMKEDAGRGVTYAAPTGKAATRLREVVGFAFTIHQALYGYPSRDEQGNLRFLKKRPPCDPGDLLVIDEASMVGTAIHKDLLEMLPEDSNILYVGDPYQLSPVNDTWGPDLHDPDALLTEIHRQAAENPIIQYATAVREGRDEAWAQNFALSDDRFQIYDGGVEKAVKWFLGRNKLGVNATLLTYTNKTRAAANDGIRERLGRVPGTIAPGDRLVVRCNNHDFGVMNGEQVTLANMGTRLKDRQYEVLFEEIPVPVKVNVDFINQDQLAFRNWLKETKQEKRPVSWLHVQYGYCLTTHSAQGSEWEEVGFIWDWAFDRLWEEDPDEARRLLYTAATRAAHRLVLFFR